MKPDTQREVVEAVVDVVVSDDLLAALEVLAPDDLDEGGRGVRRRLADEVALALAAWDRATGSLRSSGPAVTRAEFALLPWVRLLFIELAVRLAAYLSVRNIEITDADATALMAGRAFDHLISRNRDAAGGMPRDEIASDGGVSRSTVDEWLAGRGLPQSESILNLAALFARDVPGLSMPGAELHLRVAVAASEIVRWLREACVPRFPEPDWGPIRAESFVIEFTTALGALRSMMERMPNEPLSVRGHAPDRTLRNG